MGAGKVVLQYQLQSEISNLEISFFFQNTVIQIHAGIFLQPIQPERRSPAGQLKHH